MYLGVQRSQMQKMILMLTLIKKQKKIDKPMKKNWKLAATELFAAPFHQQIEPTFLPHHVRGTREGGALTFGLVHVVLILCDSEADTSWSVNHPCRPRSLLICVVQQVYQPSALINACLSDAALNLPPTLLCACVYLPMSLWLTRSQRCSADVTAQDRPGHSRTEEARAAWQ